MEIQVGCLGRTQVQFGSVCMYGDGCAMMVYTKFELMFLLLSLLKKMMNRVNKQSRLT